MGGSLCHLRGHSRLPALGPEDASGRREAGLVLIGGVLSVTLEGKLEAARKLQSIEGDGEPVSVGTGLPEESCLSWQCHRAVHRDGLR